MGTRSTTKFYDDKEFILGIYQQYDGSPSSWGQQLINFIKSGKFVNGIPFGSKEKLFNGFDDFVLQVVTHFKRETGYMYATSEHDFQEYNYIVTLIDNYIKVECSEDDNFLEIIEITEKKEADLYCPKCKEYPINIEEVYTEPVIEKRFWNGRTYALQETNIAEIESQKRCAKCKKNFV